MRKMWWSAQWPVSGSMCCGNPWTLIPILRDIVLLCWWYCAILTIPVIGIVCHYSFVGEQYCGIHCVIDGDLLMTIVIHCTMLFSDIEWWWWWCHSGGDCTLGDLLLWWPMMEVMTFSQPVVVMFIVKAIRAKLTMMIVWNWRWRKPLWHYWLMSVFCDIDMTISVMMSDWNTVKACDDVILVMILVMACSGWQWWRWAYYLNEGYYSRWSIGVEDTFGDGIVFILFVFCIQK